MRGLAPAIRVMSRSEPAAAASGSCPSTREAPAWLRSRLASACGRWLVTPTRRSCAPGSIATGRRAERRDEAVDEPETVRRSRARRGEEPCRAVEELGRGPPRPTRLRAADRVTADEARVRSCRLANRGLGRPDIGDRRRFGRHRERLTHLSGKGCDRHGDERELGRVDRVGETRGTLDGAALGRDRSASGSGSQPMTCSTPARRAARAADAPIRPVPTTASDRTGANISLASAPRRGMRDRATASHSNAGRRASRSGGRVAPRARLGAAEALGDILSRELEVNPTGPGSHLAVCREESFELVHHVVEATGLPPGGGEERVLMHRVTHPDDRVARLSHARSEAAAEAPDPVGAEPGDEREPTGRGPG